LPWWHFHRRPPGSNQRGPEIAADTRPSREAHSFDDDGPVPPGATLVRGLSGPAAQYPPGTPRSVAAALLSMQPRSGTKLRPFAATGMGKPRHCWGRTGRAWRDLLVSKAWGPSKPPG